MILGLTDRSGSSKSNDTGKSDCLSSSFSSFGLSSGFGVGIGRVKFLGLPNGHFTIRLLFFKGLALKVRNCQFALEILVQPQKAWLGREASAVRAEQNTAAFCLALSTPSAWHYSGCFLPESWSGIGTQRFLIVLLV